MQTAARARVRRPARPGLRRSGHSNQRYERHVGTRAAAATAGSTHQASVAHVARANTMAGQCHRYQP